VSHLPLGPPVVQFLPLQNSLCIRCARALRVARRSGPEPGAGCPRDPDL